MPHRADIFHSEMRYHFTNYWKTEWGIMLNKLDWEGFKNTKLKPIWKSLKKQIYLIAHYNQRWFSIKAELLQSTNSFIFHKSQFSVRPNLYVVIRREPQKHLAVLWYSHNFLPCVSLSACRDWETSQKCCAGLCYSFPGQELRETCRLPTKHGEHRLQLLQHPPHPNPALHSPKPDEKTPSLHAPQVPFLHTGVCAMWPNPTFAGSWGTAAWKGSSKPQDLNYTKAEFFFLLSFQPVRNTQEFIFRAPRAFEVIFAQTNEIPLFMWGIFGSYAGNLKKLIFYIHEN